MLLLALDTSTRLASVALILENELLGEYTWYVGNNHSVELFERIQRLLAECGSTMQDVDAIAVATGPGSFNGSRVAVAAAKAFAFSLNKPLVGVSTLDIIAAQQRQWRGPICAVLEAGRSELYAACYLFDEITTADGDISYSMRRISDYVMLSAQHLAAYIREQVGTEVGVPGERQLPRFLFCGEISPASHHELRAQMQDRILFATGISATRYASTLAMLAFQRLEDGQVDDPLLLEPLYLRRPSITTSARKQPLLGSKPNRTTNSSEIGRGEGALRH